MARPSDPGASNFGATFLIFKPLPDGFCAGRAASWAETLRVDQKLTRAGSFQQSNGNGNGRRVAMSTRSTCAIFVMPQRA